MNRELSLTPGLCGSQALLLCFPYTPEGHSTPHRVLCIAHCPHLDTFFLSCPDACLVQEVCLDTFPQPDHHTSGDSQRTFASTSSRGGLGTAEAPADSQVPEACSIQYRRQIRRKPNVSVERVMAELAYERSDLGTLHSEIPRALEPTKL